MEQDDPFSNRLDTWKDSNLIFYAGRNVKKAFVAMATRKIFSCFIP